MEGRDKEEKYRDVSPNKDYETGLRKKEIPNLCKQKFGINHIFKVPGAGLEPARP